jgi:N-acylglucosamine 2-epimerase
MKLWWPHSEALYVFPYLYRLTGEPDLLERYQKAKEYVFGTFPNRELGEWIQIRKRDGTPEEKVVALPVKDPFHILRDFIKIVELCK